VDFISRVPDNEELVNKQIKTSELSLSGWMKKKAARDADII